MSYFNFILILMLMPGWANALTNSCYTIFSVPSDGLSLEFSGPYQVPFNRLAWVSKTSRKNQIPMPNSSVTVDGIHWVIVNDYQIKFFNLSNLEEKIIYTYPDSEEILKAQQNSNAGHEIDLSPEVLALSPDGSFAVITARTYDYIQLIKTDGSGPIGYPVIFGKTVHSVEISPDSKMLTVLTQNKKNVVKNFLYVKDFPSTIDTPWQKLSPNPETLKVLHANVKQNQILTVNEDGRTVQIFSLAYDDHLNPIYRATNVFKVTLGSMKERIVYGEFLHDGKYLSFIGELGTARLFRKNDKTYTATPAFRMEDGTAVQFIQTTMDPNIFLIIGINGNQFLISLKPV